MTELEKELDDMAQAAKTLLTIREELLDTVAVPSLPPEHTALLRLDEDKLRIIAKEAKG